MKEKLKKIFGNNKEIFINYRFTFILILLNTLLALFVLDNSDYSELLTALILSNVLFFFIETFIKKDKLKYPLLLVSLVISALLNHLLYEITDNNRISFLIGGVYLLSFVLSIYKLAKKEDNFPNYFLKIVNNNIILSVASMVLELGLFFVTLSISELLLPNSSFDIITKMEILLFGLFVVPGELLCLTSTKGEPLKPLKFLTCYILLPIVLISLCVIYSYLIKIIATKTMPSNEVFIIITVLFVIAIPTYLLLLNYEDNKFAKYAIKRLPYTFIIPIMMAMYSLGIRIYHNGITITRYYGIVVIGLELIFTILALKKQNKKLHNFLLYASILIFISMIMPYTNCISVSRTSQLRRLTSLYKENTIYEKLSKKDKDAIYSSYYYLVYELDADKYLPKYLDKSKIMHNYIDYEQEDVNKYISYYNSEEKVSVNGYQYLEKISINEYSQTLADMSFDKLSKENAASLKETISHIIKIGAVTDPEIILNDDAKIFLDNIQISYNKETNKIYSLNIDGYLITK